MNTAELVKEATKEATEKATKQATEKAMNEGIKKSIRMGRQMGNNDKAIFDALLTEYGSDFTKAELKGIIKQTK